MVSVFRIYRLLGRQGRLLGACNRLKMARCFSDTKHPPGTLGTPGRHCPPQRDPNCEPVEDTCDGIRQFLRNEMPDDRNLLEQGRLRQEGLLERPCCVAKQSRDPCSLGEPKFKEKKKERPPFRSMWEPPCLPEGEPVCPELFPRFDAIYYRPSNKCRCFQRTWVECAPVKERVKKICCLKRILPPEVQRRFKEECPITCQFDYSRMRHICQETTVDPKGECKKVFWPCCKPARCDTSCRKERVPAKCMRLRAPYPCYSDKLPRLKPLRPHECLRELPSMCEVMRILKFREESGITGIHC